MREGVAMVLFSDVVPCAISPSIVVQRENQNTFFQSKDAADAVTVLKSHFYCLGFHYIMGTLYTGKTLNFCYDSWDHWISHEGSGGAKADVRSKVI